MARTPKVTKEQLLAALKRHDGDFMKTALDLVLHLRSHRRAVA